MLSLGLLGSLFEEFSYYSSTSIAFAPQNKVTTSEDNVEKINLKKRTDQPLNNNKRISKYDKIISKHSIIIFILALKIVVYSTSITLMVRKLNAITTKFFRTSIIGKQKATWKYKNFKNFFCDSIRILKLGILNKTIQYYNL